MDIKKILIKIKDFIKNTSKKISDSFKKIIISSKDKIKKAKINKNPNINKKFDIKNLKNEILIRKNSIIISGVSIILVIIILLLIVTKTSNENYFWNEYYLGIAAKSKNEVYFLGYKKATVQGIYKIDEKNKIQKIFDSNFSYLNIEGNYIYYIEKNDNVFNINKSKLDNKDKTTIISDVDYDKILVKDGWIYYFKNNILYRVRTNNKNNEEVTKKRVYTYQIIKNDIYYTYRNSNNKYTIEKMNLNNKKETVIYNNAGMYFNIKNNTIYYILAVYNESKYQYKYDLYSIKTNGKNKNHLKSIKDKINNINMSDTGIYYIKEKSSNKNAIYRLSLNGKNEEEIFVLNGSQTPINIIDEYIYYIDNNKQRQLSTYRYNMKTKETLEIVPDETIKK